MQVSRRGFVTGLAATGLGLAAPPSIAQAQVSSSEAYVQAAQLGGDVGFVVMDARSGQVLEQRHPDLHMPPASTAKTVTTLYALETLGTDYRFGTRLIATGPVVGGVIQGDLVLSGGADPTLSTDDLGAMAAELSRIGVRGITGRFLVWGGAIPYAEEIARDQPVYVSYNPAVSGLILNFNRVYFAWKRAGNGYQVTMDAPGDAYKPRAYTASMTVAARQAPLFSYSDRGGKEQWSVAASALGRSGSRWLPVRHPVAYAGDVFQTLARSQGCPLPAAEEARSQPAGTVLVTHASHRLPDILEDMLKYSTNLTAEAVGMTSSTVRGLPASVGRSGASMSQWIAARAGTQAIDLVDHSGLGGNSRVTPLDMVRVMAAGQPVGLRNLVKPFKMRDASGKTYASQPFRVDAKTGTLNFVSTLTGYMTAPNGRELVFSILTGDVDRRRRTQDEDRPAGSVQWVKRSKILQSQLLMRWGAVYG
ncbi:D-alanyl-D-alanine carboxypeptidase/D-alanyl-D-alanine-endopeptidase [Thioclava sp. 'Guangxiensis']|uniref:D-alanyl-D-alanine carboxypeptidase/D-alanyl-D-alanine endopeptidase n=1 Tax=Thioclava sp. 'Guangxiensis' TaxID=3149044 RepID=UPI003878401D